MASGRDTHSDLSAAWRGGCPTETINQEEYLQGMEWKRETHAKHETTLIETFSHEHADGKLLRNLTNKLAAQGVTLSPIPQEKVFEILQAQERLDPFTRLVATFLQHFNGSRLSLSDITQRAGSHRHPARALPFMAPGDLRRTTPLCLKFVSANTDILRELTTIRYSIWCCRDCGVTI